MKFGGPLYEGRLLQRYKRFLADVELDDGRVVTAHCPNPGSMLSCVEPDLRVWLSERAQGSRRLKWTWEVADFGTRRVFVNPTAANDVAHEALQLGKFPDLVGYDTVKREVTARPGSRLDFRLSSNEANSCWIEVKNVTLGLGSGRSAFPDSVSLRATRHLEELMWLKSRGDRAVLLFCVGRSDAKSVEPAEQIDPTYADTLRRAARAGVEVLAFKCVVRKSGVSAGRALPVLL
jgi:sugar fermentation stimulation protein A